MKAIARKIQSTADMAFRVEAIDWAQVTAELDTQGCAVLKGLLTPEECSALAAMYPDDSHFRSRIVMGRHGFGRGEYKYFAYPLPELIAELRAAVYNVLVETANEWMTALNLPGGFPRDFGAFLQRCHDQDQKRPTPLMLHYRAGDFNCLHQDL